MTARRRALVVATYEYADGGLRRLAAPEHDADSFADVLKDEAIAGFDVMDASRSRRKVLILDCCYSGAFPAGRTAKADEGVQTLERFQGKGRAVLTASDATQYAFEGNDLRGSGTSSVFTRHLVEAIRSGVADLDEDGDIALDELYSYVYDQVVAEMPQQRPMKQVDVEGRIVI